MGSRDTMSQENARTVVDGAVIVTGQTVSQQYCGGCGSDSGRAESETGKSMTGEGALLWWVWP
jgi:hypothetical protein